MAACTTESGWLRSAPRVRHRLKAVGPLVLTSMTASPPNSGKTPVASGWPVTFRFRAKLHRHRPRVLRVGGCHLPAGPLHGPQHHRLQRVARLHDGQRLAGGWVAGTVSGGGVPQGASAAAGRRRTHLQASVLVEPRSGTAKDSRPGLYMSSYRFLRVSCSRRAGSPQRRQPRSIPGSRLFAPVTRPPSLQPSPPPLPPRRPSDVPSGRALFRRQGPAPSHSCRQASR